MPMLPLALSFVQLATHVPEGTPAWVRVTAETVGMPDAEERLGLLGVTLGSGDEGPYVSPALYGAVRGRRGGLLALGFEGGWRKHLTGPLSLQTGLFLGGGGGGAAPVGSGFMTRAHLGLGLDLGERMRAGIAFSDVRWPDGEIRSRQLALNLERRFRTFHGLSAWRPGPLPGAWDVREQSFEWVFQRYDQAGGLPLTAGSRRMHEAVDLAGVIWTYSPGKRGFYAAEASTAASGRAGGYMEVLGGGGWRFPLGGRFEAQASLMAGSGGGGGLDTGGGFLLKGAVALRAFLGRSFAASAGIGQLRAPSCDLKATAWTLKAGFRGGFAAPGGTRTHDVLERQAWRLRPVWIHLSTSQRQDPAQDGKGFDLVGLQGDWILQEHAYLLGQGAFAFTHGAGAYATGLLGVGFQTAPSAGGHRLVAELRAGSGGGAGMRTGGGALVQPMAGWIWEGRGAWGVQLLGGRVESLRGGFGSHVLEAGLVLRGGSLREP